MRKPTHLSSIVLHGNNALGIWTLSKQLLRKSRLVMITLHPETRKTEEPNSWPLFWKTLSHTLCLTSLCIELLPWRSSRKTTLWSGRSSHCYIRVLASPGKQMEGTDCSCFLFINIWHTSTYAFPEDGLFCSKKQKLHSLRKFSHGKACFFSLLLWKNGTESRRVVSTRKPFIKGEHTSQVPWELASHLNIQLCH